MEKCPSKDVSAIMDFCHGKHYHAYQFLGAHPKKRIKEKVFSSGFGRLRQKRFPLWATSMNGILRRILWKNCRLAGFGKDLFPV